MFFRIIILSLLVFFSNNMVFAQNCEVVSFSKEQMYQDFDQLIEIVKKYNPQVEIRKIVMGYDMMANLQKYRTTIENVNSLGEYYNFMKKTIRLILDAHTYMIDGFYFLPYEFISPRSVTGVDSAKLLKGLDCYGDFWSQNYAIPFSFGNYLLYHDGKYYTMGIVELINQDGDKITLLQQELVKIGDKTVDHYIASHIQEQSSTLSWDYKHHKFYSTLLDFPYDKLTFRDLATGKETTINVAKYSGRNLRNPFASKNKYLRDPVIHYFFKEKILYIYMPLMTLDIRDYVLAELSRKAKNKKIEKVVFDVRNNPGGDSHAWMDIVKALTKDTLDIPCNIAIRNQEDLYRLWLYDDYVDMPKSVSLFNDQFFVDETDWHLFIPNSVNFGFSGQFYVLQNYGTKSAAHSLSSLCRHSPQFTSIGVPTGLISGNGSGPFFFQLKNSGFTFAMECDIDVTNAVSATDCYQDIPEIELALSLIENTQLEFYDSETVKSKTKKYLRKQDPYFRKILEDR